MASLLHRIFFDKNASNTYGLQDVAPLPKHVYAGGGDDGGNEPENPVLNKIAYGHRIGVYYLLAFGSLLVTLVIFKQKVFYKLFTKLVFKRDTVDDISEYVDDDGKKKIKMWLYVLLFIGVFVVVFFVMWLVGCFLYLLIGMLARDHPFKEASAAWKHIFISYNGVSIGLNFWLMFLLLILLLAVHYLGYSMFFKGWYDDMYFQDMGKKREDTQLDSFIHYYALTLLVMFTFMMILLCMDRMAFCCKGVDNTYAYYTMCMLLGYMVLSVYILKEYKAARYKRLAFISLLVFAIVFLYSFVIVIIDSIRYSSTNIVKAYFKRKFFKRHVLSWGIDISGVKIAGAAPPSNAA